MNTENITAAREALDNMDDYARIAGIDPIGPRGVLEQFIAAVERTQVKPAAHADLLEAPPMPKSCDEGTFMHIGRVVALSKARDAIWAERVQVALGMAVQKQPRIINKENAKEYLEELLWQFIDTSGNFPSIQTDPRTWEHVMVYAPVQPAASAVELSDKGWKGLVEKAQFILAKYLPPDGTDEKTTIRELLWLLDGPEYRDVLAKQAAQSPVVGLDAVDAAQLQYLLEKLNNHWGDCTWIDACDIMELGKAIDAAINSKEG